MYQALGGPPEAPCEQGSPSPCLHCQAREMNSEIKVCKSKMEHAQCTMGAKGTLAQPGTPRKASGRRGLQH